MYWLYSSWDVHICMCILDNLAHFKQAAASEQEVLAMCVVRVLTVSFNPVKRCSCQKGWTLFAIIYWFDYCTLLMSEPHSQLSSNQPGAVSCVTQLSSGVHGASKAGHLPFPCT